MGILAGIAVVIIIIIVASSGGRGELNGTYVSVGYSYLSQVTFRGNNITMESIWGQEERGTYRIEGNRMYIKVLGMDEDYISFRRDETDRDTIILDGERFIKR
jgi:hypothetical protein